MKTRRLTIHHILPALSLAVTLFIFAPVDLYLTSAEDLWFSLSDIAPWLGVMALCAFAVAPPLLTGRFRRSQGAAMLGLYGAYVALVIRT